MITASFNLKGNRWSFKVSGHALFDVRGRDIVCASVSALTIAIANQLLIDEDKLPELVIPKDIDVYLGGELAYQLPKEENSIECIAIIDTFANKLLLTTLIEGIQQIEQQYPDNIKVVVESEV